MKSNHYPPQPLQWSHNGLDGVSNHQSHHCLLSHLSGRRSKKTSKLRVTGLCAGNSPGTGEFPAPRASNAENVSIWWRHHNVALLVDETWSEGHPTHIRVEFPTEYDIHNLLTVGQASPYFELTPFYSISQTISIFRRSSSRAKNGLLRSERKLLPCHWLLCVEFTGDRWIPHIKGHHSHSSCHQVTHRVTFRSFCHSLVKGQ